MSIFGSILSKILPGPAKAAPAEAPAASPASSAPGAAPAATSAAPTTTASATTSAAPAAVDVVAILTAMEAKAGQPLNFKTSIVDLLKLLGLDSSLTARKELAKELHFSGDTNDSATMNVWLIKEVMKKLAENGGKVPDDLKH